MRAATMFSGIGAPEVAMPHWDWIWSAEIEPFPCSVLRHYRPDVPNLGDVSAEDFIDRAKALGPIDVLIYGSPCQAFSVAGLRQSLSDARGNLSLRAIEVVNAINPGIVVAENVPGWLSTPDNAFGCFLGALVGADTALLPPRGLRWTDAGVVAGPARLAAWRILDAQYFGLAQRRERVFVVASAGNGTRATEVLFEREGVQGHSAPSREAGQATTGTLAARTSGGGGLGTDFDLGGVSRSLRGQPNMSHRDDSDTYIPVISMCLNGGGHEQD